MFSTLAGGAADGRERGGGGGGFQVWEGGGGGGYSYCHVESAVSSIEDRFLVDFLCNTFPSPLYYST